MDFIGPRDRTIGIKEDPSAAGLSCAWINRSKDFVPEFREIGITVALESLARIRLVTNSVSSEITNKIQDCLTMGTAWIRCILGHLMGRIYDVRPCYLSQVVELLDGRLILEIKIKGWLILESMQVERRSGRDRLCLSISDAHVCDDGID